MGPALKDSQDTTGAVATAAHALATLVMATQNVCDLEASIRTGVWGFSPYLISPF